jgi:hypothetical protein
MSDMEEEEEEEIYVQPTNGGEGRSTDEILQDIELRRESIARTVDQVGQKVQDQLNLREQVRAHPIGALALAAGTAFLVSRFVGPRTPLDRFTTRLSRNVDGVGTSLRRSIDTFGGTTRTPFRNTLIATLTAIAARALVQSFYNTVVASTPNQTEEQHHGP